MTSVGSRPCGRSGCSGALPDRARACGEARPRGLWLSTARPSSFRPTTAKRPRCFAGSKAGRGRRHRLQRVAADVVAALADCLGELHVLLKDLPGFRLGTPHPIRVLRVNQQQVLHGLRPLSSLRRSACPRSTGEPNLFRKPADLSGRGNDEAGASPVLPRSNRAAARNGGHLRASSRGQPLCRLSRCPGHKLSAGGVTGLANFVTVLSQVHENS
jgi:hypothetical protein